MLYMVRTPDEGKTHSLLERGSTNPELLKAEDFECIDSNQSKFSGQRRASLFEISLLIFRAVAYNEYNRKPICLTSDSDY